MGSRIAEFDWPSTALGAVAAWPQSLKTAVSIILRSPAPMAILWGAEGLMIHNDPFAALVGDARIHLLGSPVRNTWEDAVPLLEEVMHTVLSGGAHLEQDGEFTLLRGGRPEQVWLDIACSPLADETGRVAGVLLVMNDSTQRVLADRKAKMEVERRRRMLQQGPGFMCLLSGPDLIVEFTNDTHDRLFGVYDAVGKPFREAFAEMSERGAFDLLSGVYRTGERYVSRAEPTVIVGPGGLRAEYFLDVMIQPITDDDERITGVFCEGFDVTEQVRAQAAAEESRRRLSAATAIARLGVFEWDLENGTPTMDERAREIYGFTPDEPLTFEGVMGRIDPADLARTSDLRAATQARRQIEYNIRLPDGSIRHVVSVSDCVVGPDGGVQRIIGILADTTERRRADERQRLLINELNHRVKNTLATVQSIAAQTLRASPDTGAARDAFEARLMALASAHDLLTAESWHGAPMAAVVASAMAPFESERQPQIQRSGSAAWVSAQHVLAISMALHELATNAVKYGALSCPDGRVSIRWRRTTEDQLILRWVERGGPRVEPPKRSGFGSRLLQRSLARELGGEVICRFDPEGVSCELRFGIEGATPAAPPTPPGF